MARPAWAMAMYRARRAEESSMEGLTFWPEFVGGGGGTVVGFRREADRNMSCHGGVGVAPFGSE